MESLCASGAVAGPGGILHRYRCPATVRARVWLGAQLPFVPHVPDLDRHGFHLSAVRLERIDDALASVTKYLAGDHHVDVFAAPVGETTQGWRAVLGRGLAARVWIHAGLQYWAVSALGLEALRRFVDRFRAATH